MDDETKGRRGDRRRRRQRHDEPAFAPEPRTRTDFTQFNRDRRAGNSKPAPEPRPSRAAAAPKPAPRPSRAAAAPKPTPRPSRAAAAPKPTPRPETEKSEPSAGRQSFNKAFAAARKAGKKEFTWRGNRYNTKLA